MALTWGDTLQAPAKINLCLLITGRRADGYHNLQTAFQLLSLFDELTFEASADFHVTGMDEPEEHNLIFRAAMLLAKTAGIQAHGTIQIKKNIPMGAGLGGGSSDAATTLVGLSALWQCGLGVSDLADLGGQLGADVPIFVRGQSAWGEGTGDQLTPLKMPPTQYLLIYPNCHVSTQAVFSHPDLTRDSSAITIARFLRFGAGNDCENVVRQLHSEVGEALDWLNQKGAAKMTGTGSCVFLRCDSAAEAKALQREVPSQWQSFVAEGLETSPLVAHLD